jgi:hypothetical protein
MARRLGAPDDLIEDHGKLVHLFLVGRGEQPGFAHLHPETRDSNVFESRLPPLPAGRYAVFADVVFTSGFTETLTSTVTIASSASPDWRQSDPDDSYAVGRGTSGGQAVLQDGSALTRIRPDSSVVVGEEAELRFRFRPPPGEPPDLEPYLGMAGHAAVVRSDDSVFIHLHPLGTISLAAQAALQNGAHSMALPPGAVSDTLYFPYAFPAPGRYTVWVQLKRRGRVLTGAFRITAVAKTP